MTQALTLSKAAPAHISMDWNRLRAEGIQHLEQLATQLWTDFNAHDPGITILEVLCYAINDLGYRSHFDLKAILAHPEQAKPSAKQYFSPLEVLTCHPVTPNDFRRLLIDLPGVKNAWLTKADERIWNRAKTKAECDLQFKQHNLTADHAIHLNGLYCVLLDLDDEIDLEKDAERRRIRAAAFDKLHAWRNLCEDYVCIDIVQKQDLALCLEVEISADADPNQVKAAILFHLENYLSPEISFYTLDQLLAKGIRCEDIYQGPVLKNGFILEADLEAAQLRTMIYTSDLYQVIMSIEGVLSIGNLKLGECEEGCPKWSESPWCFSIKDQHKPVLDPCCTNIFLTARGIDVPTNPQEVEEQLSALQLQRAHLKGNTRKEKLPEPGQFLDLPAYTSIQYDFPETYALGLYGLPESVGAQRLAEVKQLKGFLLFFDQILANYLAQLAAVRDLLSTTQNPNDRTLFYQALTDLKDIADFLPADEQKLAELIETRPQQQKRKNALLNHLLARFGESFTDYALGIYQSANYPGEFSKGYDDYLQDKADFLEIIADLHSERAQGYDIRKIAPNDFLPEVWEYSTNVSGLQKKVCRLLGIPQYGRRSLICESKFKVRIVEHDDPDARLRFVLWLLDDRDQLLLKSPKPLRRSREGIEKLQEALYALAVNADNYAITALSEKSTQFKVLINDQTGNPLVESVPMSENEAQSLQRKLLRMAVPEFCEVEGFHLIEHILLRPNDNYDKFLTHPVECAEDCDAYSFWITVLLPNWPARFKDPHFRLELERIFRREAPAHIALRFCWIDNETMIQFEQAYKKWLVEKAKCTPDECRVNEFANALILLLNQLDCTCFCKEELDQVPDRCQEQEDKPASEPTKKGSKSKKNSR